MQIDPNEWTISQPQPGTKGGKTCLVSSSSNKPIEINMRLGNPFGCPWGASSFDDDATQTRVNLDMTLDDDGADFFSSNRRMADSICNQTQRRTIQKQN